MVSKVQAIFDIAREYDRQSLPSNAGLNRLYRACNALGLSLSESIELFGRLDICDAEGKPWGGGQPLDWGKIKPPPQLLSCSRLSP